MCAVIIDPSKTHTNKCIVILRASPGHLENSELYKDDNRVVFGDEFDTFTVPSTVHTGKVVSNAPLLTLTQRLPNTHRLTSLTHKFQAQMVREGS